MGNRRQLELELWLRGHHKDDLLQGSCMLVPHEEHNLPLTALILCLQPHLHNICFTISLIIQSLIQTITHVIVAVQDLLCQGSCLSSAWFNHKHAGQHEESRYNNGIASHGQIVLQVSRLVLRTHMQQVDITECTSRM